jgi:hypothetical protein
MWSLPAKPYSQIFDWSLKLAIDNFFSLSLVLRTNKFAAEKSFVQTNKLFLIMAVVKTTVNNEIQQ